MHGAGTGARVRIKLDDDRLPTAIVLEPKWRRIAELGLLGEKVLLAYRTALWRRDGTASESLNWDSLSTVLTRRQQALTLLHADSLQHHHDIVNNAHDPRVYSFGGDTVDAAGRPAVFMIADSTLVTGVVIDPKWAATASDQDLVTELLRCVERIRTRRNRARFVADRPDLSDEQVIDLYRSHVSKLAVDATADHRL